MDIEVVNICVMLIKLKVKNKEIEKNIDKSLDEKYIGRNFGPYMV